MRRLSLLAFLLAAPVFAQPSGEPHTFAQTAAPFVDEHTLMVARVDVSRVDLDTLLKLAAAILGDGEEVGEAVPTIRGWVNDFTKNGGRDVFIAYGASDYPNLPCMIAPAPAEQSSRKALANLLQLVYTQSGKDADWAIVHGCVCVGAKEALAVVKARKAVSRPELATALDAGKDGVAQLAFALSADAKKIHEQVAPTLPTELGGGGIQKITRGMKWTALTIGPGPKMPAKWITEAVSAEAAQDLKAIEALTQQAALAQLLKSDVETDAEFRKRVHSLMDRHQSTVEGNRITSEWELATTLLEAVKLPNGPPAERVRSMNNLRQLLLALHNYHDAHGHFPTDIRDKDGKPLLSWRVQILPFIEQENLYREFKLNEPWDSEHNKRLVKMMPKVLRSPRQAADLRERTTYLAPLGKGLMWDEPKGLRITQIGDGTSNTIALVETGDDRAVIWSKPEDITIDPKNPVAGLLGHFGEGFLVALADGSVRFMKSSMNPMSLWALFTRDGGETPDFGK